ncbi:MAG: aldo/keto reductase [Gemmatimonadota bacterium]|nr:aldo/keto reductase [Gemmatimonadota bacterium]
MQKRHIGSLEVSVVGLGCNNFGPRLDAAETARVVGAALDSGINFFDTADIYGKGRSEEFLGKALGARREGILIATKFGMAMEAERKGGRPEYVRQAAEDSLRRLGTDRIDLYQLHQPDPSVPIEETLGAMNELVREGKVREIGCSNFSADMIRDAEGVASAKRIARFVSVQNEYSLLHRDPEAEVLAECARVGATFLPYFPLASGLLTGKYRRGEDAPSGARLAESSRSGQLSDARLSVVEELRQFVEGRQHTLLDLAFSWLLARPVVASVIAGATKPEQVTQNVASASWTLTADEMSAVDRITSGRRN